MPNGIKFDVQLTNFAHGIAPDFTSTLAEVMAPQCVCPAASGNYVNFDDDEAFRFVETRRALGGKGHRLQMPTSAGNFDCQPHSIEIAIDAFEIEKVGTAGLQMLRESKVRTLISRSALSREKRVFDAYAAGTTARASTGSWTSASADPIAEIDAAIADLATKTGNRNIHLVIGLGALQQMRRHPNVRNRFPGANLVNITAQAVANLLIMPVTPHVAMLPIAMEKSGKTASKGIIGNTEIYAFISQPNPSPFDPSAAKTFTTNPGQVTGVGLYEDEPFAEINYLHWSEDIKITGAACVERITVALGPIS